MIVIRPWATLERRALGERFRQPMILGSASLAALAALGGTSWAQTQSPLPQGANAAVSEGISANAANQEDQVYGQAYFSRYSLSTAEDMLRRIPGTASVLDAVGSLNQGRGLGASGDQILIDGKRMAAKSTDVVSVLRRIRATAVDRVELLRGTSASSGVLSEGLIINIVLKPGASVRGGQGVFELNQRWDNMGWRDVDGLISWSDTLGRLSYTLGYEKNLFTPPGNTPSGGQAGDYTLRTRQEVYYYPNGQVMQIRPQDWERQHHKNIFTAQGRYAFEDGSSLNLNVLFQPHPIKQTDVTPYLSFNTAGVQLPGTTLETHQNYTMRTIFEVGGEYERKAGPGELKVIAIHNRTPVKTRDFRNRLPPTGALTEVSKNVTKQTTQEDVVRASYSLPMGKGRAITLGAEGAKNTLDQDQVTFADIDRDGRQDTVADTNAIVEEQRYELFGIYNWALSSKLSVESALIYEGSKITTNYPQIPTETYGFLKPRLDIRYSLTPLDRLRAKAERSISQLNFNNFVPVYNAVDGRLDPGNASIAPEKTWTYEVAYEHRLPKDQGSVEFKGFYKDITDHIDRGPFGQSAGGLPSAAPINIPSASVKGVEAKAGVRLTLVGLPNAQVTARYQWQDSDVIDPFTGRHRSIYNLWDEEISLGFRHDLTNWKGSYGINYLATSGANITSDIRTLTVLKRDPRVNLFAEKALPRDLTLRLEIWNLTGSHESAFRALYLVSQANGAINRTETYQEIRDIRYVLRLRGKF